MELTTTRAAAAENVRVGMVRKRLTQTALAAKLGMTQQSLSRRLTGVVPFDVDELHRVAEVLGTTPTALLNDPDPAVEAAAS